jgi:hypothetical protein
MSTVSVEPVVPVSPARPSRSTRAKHTSQWKRHIDNQLHARDIETTRGHVCCHEDIHASILQTVQFALYKKEATRLEQTIKRAGYKVAGLHGDLGQDARIRALNSLKVVCSRRVASFLYKANTRIRAGTGEDFGNVLKKSRRWHSGYVSVIGCYRPC